MRVHHPNAVRDTDDDVDDGVTLNGTRYTVAADGTVDVPERAAEAWAERYGLDVADIAVGDERDEDGDTDICGAVKSDGETCERPADECPYHSDGGDD
jgi:hypothetical protein